MDPATLYRVLDQLIERFATGAEPAALQTARRQFETRRGRVFEDEDMWELASACFVECFVLEGPKDAAAPPAAAALRDPAFEQSAVLAWLRSQRSLYRVVSLSEAEVEVDDLIGGAGFRVAEPRSFQGVDRGDVMEARLVGYDGAVYFGRGFFFHPSGAHAAIARHVRTIVDSGG
ncbi:MAG: hypothetical protein KJO07_24570, partial [Deltaproteobacteria bacterium]|nr:hypothetical protein [Deltaproteobacteria bacterium]